MNDSKQKIIIFLIMSGWLLTAIFAFLQIKNLGGKVSSFKAMAKMEKAESLVTQVNTPVYTFPLGDEQFMKPTEIQLGADPKWLVFTFDLENHDCDSYLAYFENAEGARYPIAKGLVPNRQHQLVFSYHSSRFWMNDFSLGILGDKRCVYHSQKYPIHLTAPDGNSRPGN